MPGENQESTKNLEMEALLGEFKKEHSEVDLSKFTDQELQEWSLEEAFKQWVTLDIENLQRTKEEMKSAKSSEWLTITDQDTEYSLKIREDVMKIMDFLIKKK